MMRAAVKVADRRRRRKKYFIVVTRFFFFSLFDANEMRSFHFQLIESIFSPSIHPSLPLVSRCLCAPVSRINDIMKKSLWWRRRRSEPPTYYRRPCVWERNQISFHEEAKKAIFFVFLLSPLCCMMKLFTLILVDVLRYKFFMPPKSWCQKYIHLEFHRRRAERIYFFSANFPHPLDTRRKHPKNRELRPEFVFTRRRRRFSFFSLSVPSLHY